MSPKSDPAEIVGRIEAGAAIVPLHLIDPTFIFEAAIIDTGYRGAIAVPAGSLTAWGFQGVQVAPVKLADGSDLLCPFALVTVEWLGSSLEVAACEVGDSALIGIELLTGTRIDLSEERVAIRFLAEST